jgi:DNA-binding NarL/FixJ family response regulator
MEAALFNGGKVSALSPREREVLRHVAEGEKRSAIAEALRVSVSTVNYHLSSAFAKLGVHSAAAAVAKCAATERRKKWGRR